MEIELLKREVAEKIFANLCVKNYQIGLQQNLDKFAEDAIYAATVFARVFSQQEQNVEKDKAIASSWTKK